MGTNSLCGAILAFLWPRLVCSCFENSIRRPVVREVHKLLRSRSAVGSNRGRAIEQMVRNNRLYVEGNLCANSTYRVLTTLIAAQRGSHPGRVTPASLLCCGNRSLIPRYEKQQERRVLRIVDEWTDIPSNQVRELLLHFPSNNPKPTSTYVNPTGFA